MMETVCPKTVVGLPVDFDKGFDVLNRRGDVICHFDSYEEAEAMQLSDSKKLTMRFWVKVQQ